MIEKNNGRAVIEDGVIIIRVSVESLPTIVDVAWDIGSLDIRFKVTDAANFAKEFVHELNDEDEQGTTLIHRMFDKAINAAIEQGAEGIEEHEVQEP